MTKEYKVMPVRCPVLNMSTMYNSNNLEILVRISDGKLTDVVCPNYSPEECGLNKKHLCIYKEGWKGLK